MMDAERDMSSYDELVQDPIKPADNFSGQLFFLSASANCDKGVARSGVKGPEVIMLGKEEEEDEEEEEEDMKKT